MLYREAAVRLSQTIMLLTHQLRLTVDQMFEYQKEGKITEKEAATHMHKVQVVLESLYSEILDPLTADYPDLHPVYCDCEDCEAIPEKHAPASDGSQI